MIAGGRRGEQELRLRLVAYLAAVAYRMAVDAVFLGDVVADHLGIADPVNLAELHATLSEAGWLQAGWRGRDLAAACAHPAVETALREHVGSLDGMLRELHGQAAARSSLASLANLPVRASADGVRPVVCDGKPAYDNAGVRFRLAEDRIQELLMGEQLYGKPSAAIRELPERARRLPLPAGQDRLPEGDETAARLVVAGPGPVRAGHRRRRPRLPRVRRQRGRLGRRELRDLFARAGTRFAELPEYLEERYEWARCDPPVSLTPNSRFGVGVLSYFMLADEITVDTCRLERDGQLGHRLQVTIAGPGSLFRIQSLGPGAASGTTVRLYLNPGSGPISCLKVLDEVLRVAEFQTTVTENGTKHTWQPGVFDTPGPSLAAFPAKVTLTSVLVTRSRPDLILRSGGWPATGSCSWTGCMPAAAARSPGRSSTFQASRCG